MKRIGFVLAIAIVLLVPSAASAQSVRGSVYSTRSIDRYTATYDIHKDGSVNVTIDLLFNFNTEPGHGVYLRLPVHSHPVAPGGRRYPVTDVQVSSPSGAPADLALEEFDGWLNITIGDPDRGDIAGVQEYVLTYSVRGMLVATMASELDPSIAPADDRQAFDEFYWDVIGTGWDVPFDNVTIIVKGDADATDLRCFTGMRGSSDGCTSVALVDGVATFTQDHLDPFRGVTVGVAFPPHSFDTTPVIDTATEPGAQTAATPSVSTSVATSGGTGGSLRGSTWLLVGVGAGGLGLIVIAAGVVLFTRGGRGKTSDGQYPGLGPGFVPDDTGSRGRSDGLL